MSEMCQDLGRKNKMVGREMRKKISLQKELQSERGSLCTQQIHNEIHIAIFLEEKFRAKVKTVVLLYL